MDGTVSCMGQRFFPVERPDAAAAAIVVLGRRQDVYVGVPPRRRRDGRRAAIAGGFALWAECDGEPAAAALPAFEPAPPDRTDHGAEMVHVWA